MEVLLHADARGIEGVGHRLGVSPKRIARKSRNRRWRVCISAPFTVSQLRVCAQWLLFTHPLHLSYSKNFASQRFPNFYKIKLSRLNAVANRALQALGRRWWRLMRGKDVNDHDRLRNGS